VTVESVLLEALARALGIESGDASETARELGYRVGSRTDRGVSALVNVVSIRIQGPESVSSPRALLGRVNELLANAGHPLWVTAWAEVSPDFNPRHAVSRTYLYLLDATGLDRQAMTEAAGHLLGQHDFGSFCRSDWLPTILRLDRVELKEQPPWLALRFKAPAFRWHLVRRLTAALMAVGQERVTIDELRGALEHPHPDGGWGTAPAAGLTLEAVDHPELEWHAAPGVAMAARWAERRQSELNWELEFVRRAGRLRSRDEG